jgi:hypothetical protein
MYKSQQPPEDKGREIEMEAVDLKGINKEDHLLPSLGHRKATFWWIRHASEPELYFFLILKFYIIDESDLGGVNDIQHSFSMHRDCFILFIFVENYDWQKDLSIECQLANTLCLEGNSL